MNITGMNTAASERVIEMIVEEISREPLMAAESGASPCSMCRTMFSSMTMASSTTKPTASVRASSERLSRLKFSACIMAKVPITEIGSASAGMSVAERLRRNRRITRMTRKPESSSVNCTSSIDSAIEVLRS